MAVTLGMSLSACSSSKSGSSQNAKNQKVTIIVTNGKGEIAKQFEQATKDFMAANPDIIVEPHSVVVGDSVSAFDKLTASGKVVSLAMVEPITVSSTGKYKDIAADLTNKKWNQDTTYGV